MELMKPYDLVNSFDFFLGKFNAENLGNFFSFQSFFVSLQTQIKIQ